MTAIRLLTIDDVPALAALYRENREFLAPWEPVRDDEYFTDDGYRAVVASALGRYEQGSVHPCVILNAAGKVAGRINLNDIVRGPFLSANLGYWVARSDNGRGLATAAVREIAGRWQDHILFQRVASG